MAREKTMHLDLVSLILIDVFMCVVCAFSKERGRFCLCLFSWFDYCLQTRYWVWMSILKVIWRAGQCLCSSRWSCVRLHDLASTPFVPYHTMINMTRTKITALPQTYGVTHTNVLSLVDALEGGSGRKYLPLLCQTVPPVQVPCFGVKSCHLV